MESNQKRQYITEILKQHEEFILIGLTGRVGSGCSEVADVFSSTFERIGLPPIYPGDLGIATDLERDHRILFRYAAHHWLKFDVIKVRTIITSFLLENLDSFCKEIVKLYSKEPNEFLDNLFSDTKDKLMANESLNEEIEKQLCLVRDICICKNISKTKKEDEEKKDNEQNPVENDLVREILFSKKGWNDLENELKDKMDTDGKNPIDLPKTSKLFLNLYNIADNPDGYADRVRKLKEIDELLNLISLKSAQLWWKMKFGEQDARPEDFFRFYQP